MRDMLSADYNGLILEKQSQSLHQSTQHCNLTKLGHAVEDKPFDQGHHLFLDEDNNLEEILSDKAVLNNHLDIQDSNKLYEQMSFQDCDQKLDVQYNETSP